jgi:hypothetical protein
LQALETREKEYEWVDLEALYSSVPNDLGD